MSGQLPDDLLDRLRAGEHDAFNELVRRLHGPVYRLALRLLRNRDDAQEIAQDSFVAAYQGIDSFQARASLQTWLLSITYRKAVDRLRRDRDAPLSAGAFNEEDLRRIAQNVDVLTDWGANPERYFEQTQVREQLRAALARLPAEARAVFELRDVQGLSTQEAADVLGMTEANVRVRLHRVRQYLMGELESLHGGPGAPR